VGGEHADRAFGYVGFGVHEHHAAAFEVSDHVVVVHDLFADVDRRRVLAQGLLDDLDPPAHAKSWRVDEAALAAGSSDSGGARCRVVSRRVRRVSRSIFVIVA
jgi:hypothetical protein